MKRVAIAIVVSPAWWRAYKWCMKGEAFYYCFTRLVAGLQMVREIGGDCYCCFTRLVAGLQMVLEKGGVFYYCFTRLVAGLQMVRERIGVFYYCFTRLRRA